MRTRAGAARVARLATVDPDGRPHLVPITFAISGDVLYTAVDDKPKSTQRLKRLRNVETNPQVTALIDHYSDDWHELWWVRLDGTAEVLGSGEGVGEGDRLLREKYDQYVRQPPRGPVIRMTIQRWHGWAAAEG